MRVRRIAFELRSASDAKVAIIAVDKLNGLRAKLVPAIMADFAKDPASWTSLPKKFTDIFPDLEAFNHFTTGRCERIIHVLTMIGCGQRRITIEDCTAAVARLGEAAARIGIVDINYDIQEWSKLWTAFIGAAQQSPETLAQAIEKETQLQQSKFEAHKEKGKTDPLTMVPSELGPGTPEQGDDTDLVTMASHFQELLAEHRALLNVKTPGKEEDGDWLTLGLLRACCAQMEFTLYMATMSNTEANFTEAGHKYIKFNPLLVLKDIQLKAEGNRAICLNFVGRVGPLPTGPLSIHIATVCGTKLYVTSPFGKEGLVGDHFYPAWLVREQQGDEDITMQWEKHEIPMKWEFCKQVMGARKSMEVPLQLYTLVVNSKYHGKDIMMVRGLAVDQAEDEMMTAVEKYKKDIKKSAVRTDSKRGGGEEGKWKKDCKHLFK